MKLNSIFVLGLGALLTAGLFAPGCGDSDNGGSNGRDSGVDGKKDGSSDAKATGGTTALGGSTGTGGATGTGGVTGAGGATGTGGTGGSTTVGDAGLDAPPTLADGSRDIGSDAVDVPLQNDGPADTRDARRDGADAIDSGPVVIVDGHIDTQGVDTAPVVLDVAALDVANADADAAAVDATGVLDAEIDGSND